MRVRPLDGRGVYRRLMAATALGMLLNAVSVLAIASAPGYVNLMKVPGISAVPVYLGIIFHKWTSFAVCQYLPPAFLSALGRQRLTQGLQSLAERTGLAGGNDQLTSSSG